jgi:hypothetical protein
VEPEEYIKTFFGSVNEQLPQTKIRPDGKSATYKRLTVSATWADDLWEVQLRNGEGEPVRRQYDPTKARSSEGAANYFVDEIRKASGMEPILRPQLRTFGRRQKV